MVTRNLNYEELKNFKWKYYPMEITANTSKEDVINFINSKLIKTNELAFSKYSISINTISNDIILITHKGEKIFTKYNHYKNNIQIELNNKWVNWSQTKTKIKKIIFLDDFIYHESVRHLWSERGFSFIKFYHEGIKEKLINNELLKIA